MTAVTTAISPSGRKFVLARRLGKLAYSIIEASGVEIPVRVLNDAQARRLMREDLAREEAALAAGNAAGHTFTAAA